MWTEMCDSRAAATAAPTRMPRAAAPAITAVNPLSHVHLTDHCAFSTMLAPHTFESIYCTQDLAQH